MMTNAQVAVAKAIQSAMHDHHAPWEKLARDHRDNYLRIAAAAIAALSGSPQVEAGMVEAAIYARLKEIAIVWSSGMSGLPTGDDVAEYLCNDIGPDLAETLEALRPREQEGGEAPTRDEVLAAVLHEFGPEGCSKVLARLPDAKVYVSALRRLFAHPPLPADGWKVVPVTPTAEMLMRGQHFYDKTSCGLVDGDDPMAEAWSRMLEAAPTPPASTEGGK